ncbi:hypothetical protein MBLNU459_g0214t1 [Dothideomycetes sp. NU459]
MAPAPKRRKTGPTQMEELSFDFDARQDYLTGFHKRKVQRTKRAQEEAAKLAREEKIRDRRQLREQRKQDLERHVAEVNTLTRQQNPDLSPEPEDGGRDDEGDEWNGIAADLEPAIDGVDEYVDEDKFTTVTIEAMDDAKAFVDGTPSDADVERERARVAEKIRLQKEADEAKRKKQSRWKKDDGTLKQKKKKFRYESKGERQQTRRKQSAKNSAAAKARKEA